MSKLDRIKDTLLSVGERKDKYNCDKLFKYAPDCKIAFCAGARRIGKTYLGTHAAIEHYLRYSEPTLWLRNKKVEFENGFYNSFLNSAHSNGWCPDTWTCCKDGVFDEDNNIVIGFQSMSTFSNLRGNEFNYHFSFFDEYMPEDRSYPKNCHKGLMSIIKTTMARFEDSFCLCASNFIESSNPYWLGYGIYPDQKKDVSTFYNGKVAIEICRGYTPAILPDNPWVDVFKGGKYADYESETEDALFQLVKKSPKGLTYPAFVYLIDGTYYRGGTAENGITYFSRYNGQISPSMSVYTPNLDEMRKGVYRLSNGMKDDIKYIMDIGCARFDDPNVMRAILSTVYNVV